MAQLLQVKDLRILLVNSFQSLLQMVLIHSLSSVIARPSLVSSLVRGEDFQCLGFGGFKHGQEALLSLVDRANACNEIQSKNYLIEGFVQKELEIGRVV